MKKIFRSFALGAVAIFLIPVSAFAVTGLPFGGKVISNIPCTCGYTVTRMTILTPKGIMINLDYQYGTQGYSKYNLPWGRQVLGKYFPSPVPICWDYIGYACYARYTPPALGFILPIVGSSI
jgi:hypothetical protein